MLFTIIANNRFVRERFFRVWLEGRKQCMQWKWKLAIETNFKKKKKKCRDKGVGPTRVLAWCGKEVGGMGLVGRNSLTSRNPKAWSHVGAQDDEGSRKDPIANCLTPIPRGHVWSHILLSTPLPCHLVKLVIDLKFF